jgi:S-DNA-T family DNA segregation ATPase FtsK/SpoIIIE
MRLSVCVNDQRQGGPRALDVTLGAVASDATVAELLDAVSRRHPGWLTTPAGPGRHSWDLDLDGTAVSAAGRLADLALRAGSILRLTPTVAGHPHGWTAHDHTSAAAYELAKVAGPDSGLTLGLGRGAFALGRTDEVRLGFGPVGQPVVRVEVGHDGTLITAVAPVRVDGTPLAHNDTVDGSMIAFGDAVFALRPAPLAQESTPDGRRDTHGRQPLIRTPRVATVAVPAQVPVPQPPAPATTPAPLSWLLLLAPLPIGVVMALVFSPFFLVMTAMTPLMSLARWVEGKYRSRKDTARIAAELANAAVQFGADLDAARAMVARAARTGQTDLAELSRRASSGRGLWEVRPGDADELRVVLGIGDQPWQPSPAVPWPRS